MPSSLSDCSHARAALLPLHVGFAFVSLFLFSPVNTHRLQGSEDRWRRERKSST